MSTQNSEAPRAQRVVCTHSLTVKLDQLDNGKVGYSVELDPEVARFHAYSPAELCRMDMPITHLGIRALKWMLMKRIIVDALNLSAATRKRYPSDRQPDLFRGPGRNDERRPLLN